MDLSLFHKRILTQLVAGRSNRLHLRALGKVHHKTVLHEHGEKRERANGGSETCKCKIDFHLPVCSWQNVPLNPGGHIHSFDPTGVPPLTHFGQSDSCDVCVTGGLHFVPLQQTTSES